MIPDPKKFVVTVLVPFPSQVVGGHERSWRLERLQQGVVGSNFATQQTLLGDRPRATGAPGRLAPLVIQQALAGGFTLKNPRE